ncbi:transcriptional regulator PpsR [Sphingomonas humi]|uniref:Transcriptional regulator PpsR n=1 Tax=Sphingomonas humi TaxID=335630 RepID=A0ABP7RUS2_9SPHN
MKQASIRDDGSRRFDKDSPLLAGMDAAGVARLAEASGDLALLVDEDGVIRDIAAANDDLAEVEHWVGQRWSSVVTVESRVKVEEILGDDESEPSRWRQINHSGAANELPLRFRAVRLPNGATVAVGRDERATARLQQRLLQVQQSLERDYLRLRQAESRYRLLFEMTGEPMLIVDLATLRIREINPAGVDLLAGANLQGQPFVAQASAADRDKLVAFIGAVSTGILVPPVTIALARSGTEASLSARLFRQGSESFLLIQLGTGSEPRIGETERLTLDMVRRLPDALVLADDRLEIVDANDSFLELVHVPALAPLIGRPLGDFLGRPGIDLDLIRAQVADHRVARNVSTILRGEDGGQEEVEVSAVRSGDKNNHYAFTMRLVARRLRDLPPVTRDLPRSVEQLTELVGRMPLKDIVRESTDLIERLCIEAALTYTSNNRASAAEILGLSRQSLYSKLNRHGLGRVDEGEISLP